MGPHKRSGQGVAFSYVGIWGFPKIRGTILGVPIKDYNILGLYWGPPTLRNYQITWVYELGIAV